MAISWGKDFKKSIRPRLAFVKYIIAFEKGGPGGI